MAWTTYLIAGLSAFAAVSCGAAVWSTRVARRTVEAARSLARVPQSFESQLRALTERQDACEALLQKIDARDRMRRVRAGREDADPAVPDVTRDPIGWKNAMRRKFHVGSLRHQEES